MIHPRTARHLAASLALAGLLLGAPAHAAEAPQLERANAPIGEISVTPAPGTMETRYLRQLQLRVGDRVTASQLDLAAKRLSALPNIDAATVRQEGSLLNVALKESPVAYVIPIPFPFIWEVGALSGLEQWHVGDQYLTGHLEALYIWDRFRVYDPSALTPSKQLDVPDLYGYGSADVGTLFAPDWRVLLMAEDYAQSLGDFSGSYAPKAQTNGNTLILGPELRYDHSDDPAFPRLGTRFRVGAYFGSPYLGDTADFALYRGEIQRYMPVGDREALVASLTAGTGRGEIPWHEKFQAGGITNLRGYAYERFMGDRLLVGTLEYRRRLFGGVGLMEAHGTGVTGGLFLEAGRAWESRLGTPFPQDIRPSVGGYLAFTYAHSNIARLEAGVGTEGPVLGIAIGMPFDWL